MRIVLVLLALGALSCGRSFPLTVAMEHHISDEHEAAIDWALYRWNSWSGRECFRWAENEAPDVWITEQWPRAPGAAGSCQVSSGQIRIAPDLPIESVRAVALHEAGHALGMEHTSTGVMAPDILGTDFSDEDRAEFKRAGGCR